jgi:hypothetical protein
VSRAAQQSSAQFAQAYCSAQFAALHSWVAAAAQTSSAQFVAAPVPFVEPVSWQPVQAPLVLVVEQHHPAALAERERSGLARSCSDWPARNLRPQSGAEVSSLSGCVRRE